MGRVTPFKRLAWLSVLAMVITFSGASHGADRTSRRGIAIGGDGWFGQCVAFENFSVECWSDKTRDSNANALRWALSFDRPIQRLAVGARGGCVLLEQGEVRCWKRPDRGHEPKLTTIDLGRDRSALSIAAGNDHYCVILDTRDLKCWGSNYRGQLGIPQDQRSDDIDPRQGDELPNVDLGTGRKAQAIAAGGSNTCALLDDESLKCWGENTHGNSGLGFVGPIGGKPGDMGDHLPAVDLGPGHHAVVIGMDFATTCVVIEDWTMRCWGTLGFSPVTRSAGAEPGTMGANLEVIDIGGGLPIKDIQCAQNFCAVLLANHAIKTFGSNDSGQNGSGLSGYLLPTPDTPFVDLGRLAQVEALSVGFVQGCGLLSDGQVKCWGEIQPPGVTARNAGLKPGSMGEALQTVRF